MNLTPDSMLVDPQQIIANLRRELDECRSERDRAQKNLNETTTERNASLARETAMAEVLEVINRSPGDLAPVFDSMLDKATRLCEASFGTLWTYDGESMQAVAIRGSSSQYTEFLKRGPHRPSPVQRRLIRGETVVQIADVSAGEGYRSGDPLGLAHQRGWDCVL